MDNNLIKLYQEYETLQQLINKPCLTLDEDFDIKKFYQEYEIILKMPYFRLSRRWDD